MVEEAGETPSRTLRILYIYCSNVSDSESVPVGDGLTERDPKSAIEFHNPYIQYRVIAPLQRISNCQRSTSPFADSDGVVKFLLSQRRTTVA